VSEHETICYCDECVATAVHALMLSHPYTIARMGETCPLTAERALAYFERDTRETLAVVEQMIRDGGEVTPKVEKWVAGMRQYVQSLGAPK
jgi:hypothetical protein